jgi:hypothetical protein
MTRVPDAEQQLAHYREMKRLAVESYRRKLVWPRPAGSPQVQAHFQQITARWETALADPAALRRLFALKPSAPTCWILKTTCMASLHLAHPATYRLGDRPAGTALSLYRRRRRPVLRQRCKSQQALLGDYAQKRQQAQRYLLNAAAAKD